MTDVARPRVIMSSRFRERYNFSRCRRFLALVVMISAILPSKDMYSQTASTGAITGVILDRSGAALPGVALHVTKEDGPEEKSAISDSNGRFVFLMLTPGSYSLR